ncbi:phytoene desaturase [Halobacteriales archaeon QS_1_69_70]|nr:MAG: phytoene desaturase [Halobacteriales archaeon QS_1_69_70]
MGVGMSVSEKSVVVIGGGFGGLSASCYLAEAGADVTLVEKNCHLGGRANRLKERGFKFDMGPVAYTTPDVFEDFFADFDRSPDQFYSIERLNPNYRVFFDDGDRIDIPSDRSSQRETFERLEPGAGEQLDRYLDQAATNYEIMMDVISSSRAGIRDWLDPRLLGQLWHLSPLRGTLKDTIEDHFTHPKLQQVLTNATILVGSAPSKLPGFYTFLSHLDFNEGIYYPEDGMASVVEGVVELARDLGVKFETRTAARAIRSDSGSFTVQTSAGDHTTDIVVSNADYEYTESELLSEDQRGFSRSFWRECEYTPSMFVVYLGVEGDLGDLRHHSWLLPPDSKGSCGPSQDSIWPDDPIVYVNAPSITDDSVAPEGHSALYLMSTVSTEVVDSSSNRAEFRDTLLSTLDSRAGCDVRDRIVVEEHFSISEFAERYNSTRGSAYGLAQALTQSGPFRPPHRSKELPGMYFVGANTNPGIGVAPCLLSGKICAEKVIGDVLDPDRTSRVRKWVPF